ncbi:MAG: hypothetical protein EBU46_10415 [Nitrosomonadaceae bacterium]|nr:hypothetical protein [Nitrosomonadaceae bacterium]
MTEYTNIGLIWKHADVLTVRQAAALIAGIDPSLVSYDGDRASVQAEDGSADRSASREVQAVFDVLTKAIIAKTLKATIRRTAWQRGYDEQPEEGKESFAEQVFISPGYLDEPWQTEAQCLKYHNAVIYCVFPDWDLTTVKRAVLVAWLEELGHRAAFFFSGVTECPDYLDRKNPRYAPKLAAAVRAWQAVTDPHGTHPKQALQNWLLEHARELGLTRANGKPNQNAIDEIAKVANWRPSGGAPKTPGK